MKPVADFIISQVLVLLVSYTIVAADRAALPVTARRRGWNAATTGSAILFFAPLCLVAHFWVTRRSVRGVVLGLAWTVADVLLVLLLASFPLILLPAAVVLLASGGGFAPSALLGLAWSLYEAQPPP